MSACAQRGFFIRLILVVVVGTWGLTGLTGSGIAVAGTKLVLRDGRTVEGNAGKLPRMTADRLSTAAGGVQLTSIQMVDTGLVRYFFPDLYVKQVIRQDASIPTARFFIKQRKIGATAQVNNVGAVLRKEPFNEFGRRIFVIPGPKGPIEIIQGITLITPKWTKVEGLNRYKWDMRVATSSIPPTTLRRIIGKAIDPTKAEQRLRVASFYIQSDRYGDARRELEQVLKDFPDRKDLRAQVARVSRELTQERSRRILSEINLRRGAGQHQL
ncbi:MAG: tetratricopeptide repeat protein, partial [Planctomycetales bacterium]